MKPDMFQTIPVSPASSSAKTAEHKRPLAANLTGNMSILQEQGSFFGMSEASTEKSVSAASADLDKNHKSSRSASQISASRQLGLAPTELDIKTGILEEAGTDNPVAVKASQQSRSLTAGIFADASQHDSKRDHSALRMDTGPSSQSDLQQGAAPIVTDTKINATGRLGTTVSTPVGLADFQNMLNRLEPVQQAAEKDPGANIPIRRRRAQPRPLSVSGLVAWNQLVPTQFSIHRHPPNQVASHLEKSPNRPTWMICSRTTPGREPPSKRWKPQRNQSGSSIKTLQLREKSNGYLRDSVEMLRNETRSVPRAVERDDSPQISCEANYWS